METNGGQYTLLEERSAKHGVEGEAPMDGWITTTAIVGDYCMRCFFVFLFFFFLMECIALAFLSLIHIAT